MPRARVTFLFTDIEGSTRLVQEVGADRYGELLARHSALLREAAEAHGGREFGMEGDAHFFAFGGASEALRAAVDAQRSFAAAEWPGGTPVRVRMGLHTGTPERRGKNYVGVDLSRVARITAAGHGGQILASEPTQSEAAGPVAPVRFNDLGQHRLKDLIEPEHIFQVTARGLLVEFPPIRSIDTRPKSLPAQVSSFVGRADELAAVGNLLAAHRLLTLSGPGGSGKSRLAIAAADRALPSFEDGVFFVPLAPLRDPEMLPFTTSAVLGIREGTDRPLLATLLDHLATRQVLLVFDNFEHLLAGARMVTQLLEAAPRLRVLVTSRILLHLSGEHDYPVPPLPLPAHDASLSQLAANPAVALFVDRAASVSPDFSLTDATARSIAEVCRRVDGLPLAIELAAARMRILSPAELARRLDHRLTALIGGAQDLPDRQRTLRATIEWSHDLLDAPQRTLFARLSVFDGGWSSEALEAVAGDGLGAEALDLLQALVDQSLVRRETGMATPRFGMLETIREFAAERLETSGDAAGLAERHASYFRDLAESSEPQLTGVQAPQWAERLRLETDNLRAALRWSLADERRLELGQRLAAAIWRFWQQTGVLSEGREWLEVLLAARGEDPTSPARVKALIAAGGIAYWQNDFEAMTRFYDDAARMAEEIGDPRLLAEALDAQTYVAMFSGEFDRVRDIAARARELFLQVGERFRAALVAANAAYLAFYEGGYETAIEPMREMIEEARRTGERYWLINGLTGLGQLTRVQGNVPEARRYYAEALQLAMEDANLALVTMALDPLANLEFQAGEPERAVRLWAASDAIRQRIGGGAPPEEMRVVDPREAAVAAIGQEAVDRAWSDGQAMTPAEAVREARAIAGMDAAGGDQSVHGPPMRGGRRSRSTS